MLSTSSTGGLANQPQRMSNFEAFYRTGFGELTKAGFFLKALGRYICPLTMIIGFRPRWISICSMHTSNLGICGWVNAAALLTLLERDVFGPASEDLSHRLQVVTLRFRRWCAANGIQPQSRLI